MGSRLAGRLCRLTVSIPVETPGNFSDVTSENLVFGGDDGAQPSLRIQFKIKKNLDKTPNTAEITVSNLSPYNRGRLQTKGVKVLLEAGYTDAGISRYYRGDARTIDHVRDGADWNTVIKCGDGERAYRHARVNLSFAAGTSYGDALKRIAQAMGIPLGNVPLELGDDPTFGRLFDQGYTASGQASAALDKLVHGVGFTWSIQDEALQILAPGQALDAAIPFIDSTSGLIGSPEMGTPDKKSGKALAKVKFLLQPVVPGGKIHIRSERYKSGELTIKTVEFSGDTHGQEWYATVDGSITSGSP